ncbi:MAG: hypothetical protein WD800_04180, partial [Dehalococcoidia bacterium]
RVVIAGAGRGAGDEVVTIARRPRFASLRIVVEDGDGGGASGPGRARCVVGDGVLAAGVRPASEGNRGDTARPEPGGALDEWAMPCPAPASNASGGATSRMAEPIVDPLAGGAADGGAPVPLGVPARDGEALARPAPGREDPDTCDAGAPDAAGESTLERMTEVARDIDVGDDKEVVDVADAAPALPASMARVCSGSEGTRERTASGRPRRRKRRKGRTGSPSAPPPASPWPGASSARISGPERGSPLATCGNGLPAGAATDSPPPGARVRTARGSGG